MVCAQKEILYFQNAYELPILTLLARDSEDSAPAEFPPEQPEADLVEDDGTAYGAEEVELEKALIEEEAALKAAEGEGEDEEMVGAEDTSGPVDPAAKKAAEDDDDADSDNGSEDLEADSSGSEDEEIEEEEGEGEGDADEDMDMGEDGETKPAAADGQGGHVVEASHGEVMVH